MGVGEERERMLSWEHGGVKVATERVATMRASDVPASHAQGQLSSQAGGYSMAAGQVSRGHVGAASASIPASMPMPMPMPTASATPQRVPGAPTLTPGARRRVPGAPGTGARLQRRGSSQPAVQASTPARRVPGAPSPLRSKRLAKAQSSSTTLGTSGTATNAGATAASSSSSTGGSASSGPRDESTFANGPQLSVYTVTEQNIEKYKKMLYGSDSEAKESSEEKKPKGWQRLRERTKWKAGDSCAICMRGAITGRCKPCSHRSMCEACYQEYKEEDRGVFCPICFEEVNILLSDSVASMESLGSDDSDDSWEPLVDEHEAAVHRRANLAAARLANPSALGTTATEIGQNLWHRHWSRLLAPWFSVLSAPLYRPLSAS